MEYTFPRTRAVTDQFEWRSQSPSTNAELRELVAASAMAASGAEAGTAAGRLPHGTVLATLDQPAGRGRLGRGWVIPPGTGLALSVLLRIDDSELLSWLPLIAGSAVARALQPWFAEVAAERGEPMRVGVKWPNDVHVRTEADAEADRPGRKLSGILCELLPSGEVVVGIGVNLFIDEWELPTERATSLLAAGAVDEAADREDIVDRILADTVSELLALVDQAQNGQTAPGQSQGGQRAVRIRIARDSLTLGSEVRVHLPDGTVVDGRARMLADDGALVVDRPTGSQLIVHAGDVEHLR